MTDFKGSKKGYARPSSGHPDGDVMGTFSGGNSKMIRKWAFGIAILIAAGFLSNIAFYLVYPDVSRLKRERPGKTSFMEYRERQRKREGLQKHIRQKWVPLARISPYAVKAVIIAEDDEFRGHEERR